MKNVKHATNKEAELEESQVYFSTQSEIDVIEILIFYICKIKASMIYGRLPTSCVHSVIYL